MPALTAKQHAILAFLRERIATDGVPPSQWEIATAFGFKQNATANYHLRALEQAGAIARTPGQARSIRVVGAQEGSRPTRVPSQRSLAPARTGQLDLAVLGRVAAGAPIGNDTSPIDDGAIAWVTISRSMFSPTPDYLLRVEGDSMRDDGIFDGDLVAVRRASEGHHGQVVVARIDGEVTIKRLQLTATGIRLLPRNPDYAAIDVPADADFAIEGIYCGLVRSA